MTDDRSVQLKALVYVHVSRIICTATLLFAQHTQFGNQIAFYIALNLNHFTSKAYLNLSNGCVANKPNKEPSSEGNQFLFVIKVNNPFFKNGSSFRVTHSIDIMLCMDCSRTLYDLMELTLFTTTPTTSENTYLQNLDLHFEFHIQESLYLDQKMCISHLNQWIKLGTKE